MESITFQNVVKAIFNQSQCFSKFVKITHRMVLALYWPVCYNCSNAENKCDYLQRYAHDQLGFMKVTANVMI